MYFYDDERLCIFEVGSKRPVALYTDSKSFWNAVNNKYHALPLFNKEVWYNLND